MKNVAIVGTKELINLHLNAWSQLRDIAVSAIFTVDEDANVPERLHHKVVDSIADLLSMDIDLIDLCVSNDKKAGLIRQLSKDGIHIVCSAPLATNVEEASAIINECKQSNVHLFVGNSKRFSPEYSSAREQVANGKIGDPGVIRLSSKSPYQGSDDDIFTNLGIPEFDWLTWTFGDVERVTTRYRKKESLSGDPVEYALVALRMKDQSFAHLELSLAGSERQTSFELAGNKGMLTYNSKESYPIEIHSANKIDLPEEVLTKTALRRQVDDVIKWMGLEDKPTISPDNTLQTVKIAEAARQSAITGEPISVKEVF